MKERRAARGSPFCLARPAGRTHLGGESPPRTRQGESLAGRQGCPSRGGIRRKPQAKRWSDEQKPHKRRQSWIRRPRSSKSNTCTESFDVYAADISGKVGAQYPGRSVALPFLGGWIQYFRLAEVKGIFEELDGWIRRRLRCLIWRRWKRPFTRAKNLMRRGLEKLRAWKSATNGRGAWWNAGASHLNEAFPKSYFDRLGLKSLLEQLRKLQFST